MPSKQAYPHSIFACDKGDKALGLFFFQRFVGSDVFLNSVTIVLSLDNFSAKGFSVIVNIKHKEFLNSLAFEEN